MTRLIAIVPSLLAMVAGVASTSAGQAVRPSVYIEPPGRLGACLASSMVNESVPIALVTDRGQAAYVLSTSPITTGTAYEGFLEFTVAKVSVVVQNSTSGTVVWTDFLSEPTEGSKTQQVLAERVAKRLKKVMQKNHGGLAGAGGPERSHSIAALVGSVFHH